MRDPARIAATIELLDSCEASWKAARPLPADIIIHHYFKARRYLGSKDRGSIAELAYAIIRARGTLLWWCEREHMEGARAIVIAALLLQKEYSLGVLQQVFNGEKFSPTRLTAPETAFVKKLAGQRLLHPDMPDTVRYNYPEWMETQLRASLGAEWKKELAALSEEATVDLRANTLLTTRDELLAALKKEKYDVMPTPHSPLGVRLKTRMPVFTSEAFKKGWFEMQDEGSQLVTLLLNVRPGEKVIDFCAGAGGKTLALSAEMKNKGRILAWDTSKKRLDQMTARIRRAKADNIQRHVIDSENDAFIKRHKDSADAVLIDAPCSGSGTWRRNPDLKWRFSRKEYDEIISIQSRILDSASRLVKKGGRLLYVTCSLLRSENADQIESFLNRHKNFKKFGVVLTEKIWNKENQQTMRRGDSIQLTPHQDGTDGFYAALLERSE